MKKTSEINNEVLEGKLKTLKHQLEGYLHGGVLVAFSGGVDSTFLLWVANAVKLEKGGDLVALTTLSPSMPKIDFKDAKKFTTMLDIEHIWRKSQELQNDSYSRNDFNRCYFCKAELFDVAKNVIKEKGYSWILYGYNASDKFDFRPGHRAALENNVLFPLAVSGFSKEEIRRVLAQNKLEIAEKPASPCLSSRIMHGIPVNLQILNDIQDIEDLLRKGGVKESRVRICADKVSNKNFLRIEVNPVEMNNVVELRDKILQISKDRGYKWTTLDLQGYRLGGGTV